MAKKRYFYDSKGRSTGFSSDEGPGTRNAKALMIGLPLLALISMCGVEIKPGPGAGNSNMNEEASAPDTSTPRAADGSIAYLVTGPANLRYDTSATNSPIVGELARGEQIVGEPRKGADNRTWVMISEGPRSGSFVWAGNLRRTIDRPKPARKRLAYKSELAPPDAHKDVDCSVVVAYFDTAFEDQGVPDDQQEAMASWKAWYLRKSQIVASQLGAKEVEKRALQLTAPGEPNLKTMKHAFAECTKRAVREGLR